MLSEVTKVSPPTPYENWPNFNLFLMCDVTQLLKRIIESYTPSKSIRNQTINRSYVNKIRHEPSRHMRQRLKTPYDLLMFSLNRKYDIIEDEIVVGSDEEEEEEENENNLGIICHHRDDEDIEMVDGQFINYLQGRHLLEHVDNNHHGDSLLDSLVGVNNNSNHKKFSGTKSKKIIPNQNCKLRSLLDRIFAEVEKYASKFESWWRFRWILTDFLSLFTYRSWSKERSITSKS